MSDVRKVQVKVAGLAWGPYTVPCPRCGATAPWTLVVERVAGGSGEDAWGRCRAGHQVRHPLIYPAMVRGLAEVMTDGGVADPAEAAELLGDLQWRPHRRHLLPAEADDEVSLLLWWPWEREQAGGLEWWRQAWPDLVAVVEGARRSGAA